MRVLLTGATGLIGCHTAAALVERGFAVRALVRDPAKLARALAPFAGAAEGVEVVRGDVTDAASVAAALEGCEALVHGAGVFSHALADAGRLERTNVDGTRIVLESAAAKGLDPIVHVSSMLALFPPRGARISADDPVSDTRAMYSATKARAEQIARALQAEGAPVVTVYPSSVQGPHDPTVGSGPEVTRNQLRTGRVLVTEGGLCYSDVRDVAALLARLVEPGKGPRRVLTVAEFVPHDALHRMLSEITGRDLVAQRLPGWLLRAMGRIGDLLQGFGRDAQLTSEGAMVLTRSVPFDDGEARALLGREPIDMRRSFADLLAWMAEAGELKARHVGSELAAVAGVAAEGGGDRLSRS